MAIEGNRTRAYLVSSSDLDPHRWRSLALGISALGLTLLDLSIVSVILPPIGAATGANPTQLLWVVSGYALAIGIVPIVAGRLGDDYGRRRMLLIGIAGFVLMSAAVGLAPNVGLLLAARFVQGLAGGLINPQVSGVVQQLFPLPERGRAFGWIGAAVGVFTAAGPVVGGALVALGGPHFGWRLCFLVNVPIGIAVFVLCRMWWPPAARQVRRRLDLPGVGLLTIALLCVLFPAVEFTTRHDPLLALFLVPAAVFAAAFIWWEAHPARRRGYPLIDVTLFAIRSFANGLSVGLLFFCAFNGLGLVLALYLQDGIGMSAAKAGGVVALYAAGTAVGALVGGRLLPRLGSVVLPIALGVFAVGVTAAGIVSATLSGRLASGALVAALAGPLLVAGLGGGGVVSPNQALALADLGARGGSTAGGMLQTAQRIGNAVGAAVISAAFYYVATSGHASDRAAHYGLAYGLALLVTLLFGVGAFVVAVADIRRRI
ncbi:MAG: Arabinose efflux permease [Pseudonocardiales bacterium]|nr:Arabinose efflux permease [Pseudonocardiales bacterium]